MQVYDYLVKTPAGQQTRENVVAFLKATEQFKLTKAESLQASNLRPASAVEVHLVRCPYTLDVHSFHMCFYHCSYYDFFSFSLPLHSISVWISACAKYDLILQIVEDCDERLSSDAVDQFLASVEEILPPMPEPEAVEDDAGAEEAEPEADEMEAEEMEAEA